MKKQIRVTVLLLTFSLFIDMGNAHTLARCRDLPDHDTLRMALKSAVLQSNGGLGLPMWATLVNRDGFICTVVYSGNKRDDQWPGSRLISAQKAYTANAFSLPGLALSTANLWAATQPGGSLFGLQFSNPIDTAVAYGKDPNHHGDNNAEKYGTAMDPMLGSIMGGINVFGGGLPLYSQDGRILGGLGVSGDSSCGDHNIAWRVRDTLGLDYVPLGVGTPGDNIIFDLKKEHEASGFGHPECGFGDPDSADNLAVIEVCPIGDGATQGCI